MGHCKMKDESGSIVVEAAMALPIFMFAIITILSIIEICTAQMVVTNSANSVAKDFSKFSYLCCKVGAFDMKAAHDNKAANANKVASSILNANNLSELMDAIDSSVGIISEDENFAQSMCYMLITAGEEVILDFVGQEIINNFLEKRLSTETHSALELLQHYGMQNGLGDISWKVKIDTSNEEIYIIADYSVKVWKLLDIDFTYDFSKVTRTKIWNPATNYPDRSSSKE